MTTDWGFVLIVFALLTIAVVDMALCALSSRISRQEEEREP